ncbi:hypothetical protein PIB30_087402 [Stylosanthes scabra]|uniref:Uncharacterized protein n=1 Tax=Stylosanthes scabra TaxID=79078 RepID=A0ABU6YSD7_9FABA|nr:hypothetical protein [Stylosanthes scabra]
MVETCRFEYIIGLIHWLDRIELLLLNLQDSEEASASLTPSSPPKRPSGAYDDPHYWDYDGDLDQWGTDVFGGEPATAQASDSAEGSEGSYSTSAE